MEGNQIIWKFLTGSMETEEATETDFVCIILHFFSA